MLQVEFADSARVQSDQPLLIPTGLTAVIGPNGAGKSSLLAALAGEQPVRQLLLDGEPLLALSGMEQARQRVVLHQQHPIDFPLSVFEVVEMGCYPHEMTGQARTERVAQALRDWQLEDKALRRIDQLSGGEQQRVHLARAQVQVAQSTRLLLLDEPTAALDLKYQSRLLRWLKSLPNTLHLLVVLHDPVMAARLADQLLLVQAGRVTALAPPQQLWTQQTLGALYDLQLEAGWGERGPWLAWADQ